MVPETLRPHGLPGRTDDEVVHGDSVAFDDEDDGMRAAHQLGGMERDVEKDVFEVAPGFGDGPQHSAQRGLTADRGRQPRFNARAVVVRYR